VRHGNQKMVFEVARGDLAHTLSIGV
jgi:hypothetical protein